MPSYKETYKEFNESEVICKKVYTSNSTATICMSNGTNSISV